MAFHKNRTGINPFFRSVVSILISVALIFTQGLFTPAFADESGVAFAGFNQQNMNLTAANWTTVKANVSPGSGITMDGNADGQAVYYINLSDIAASVDCGTLTIDFSVLANIADETGTDLDSASAKVSFRETENGADSSHDTMDRGTGTPGTPVALTSNAAIPSGTRFIFVTLSGVMGGETNTVSFTSPSLIIHDNQNPTLTAAPSTTDWTNKDVTVNLTAADTQSGVKGIYDASNSSLVSSGKQYTRTFTANGSASYYAQDYAGNKSQTQNVSVTNIDKNAPQSAPDIALSQTSWTNLPVTFTLSQVAAASGESPEKRQYRLNGGNWTDYTDTATVSSQGTTTIDSRTVDAVGNASDIKTAKVYVDTVQPIIDSLTSTPHNGGGATVTFMASDSDSGIAQKRWAAGNKDASFFATGGTILSGDSFDISAGGTYTVFAEDYAGNTAIATVNVDMSPAISTIGSQNLNEDAQKEVDFTVSDEVTDAGSLQVSATSSNTSILPDPQCTNTNGNVSLILAPIAGKNGTVTVTVCVKDGTGNISTSHFTVNINSVNDAPVAVDDSATVQEDGQVVVSVLSNDTDADGDTLTIVSAGPAANGTVTVSADKKTATYKPNANYNGPDSFMYTVTDGQAVSNQATVSIDVQEVNDAPVAVADTVTLAEDTPTLINVLANDTDADLGTTTDEALTVVNVSSPSNGTAAVQPDGTILYTPTLNWSGSDSFTYTIHDRKSVTSQATVRITVTAVNDLPVFSNLQDAYTVLEDCGTQTINFDISDVETGEASLMLQATSSDDSKIPNSSLQIGGLGDSGSGASLQYTPVANANGAVTITFKLGDGFATTTKTVIINITPVNDDPVANPDSYAYTEDDNSLVINMDDLVKNDTDIDGDTLHFVAVTSQPGHGQLSSVSGNSYRYTPDANYNGNDTFTYSVSDGTATATGVVTLHGTPVNDAPTIQLDANNNYTTTEDNTLSGVKFQIADLETAASGLIVTAGSSNPTLVSAGQITINKQSDGACTLSVQPNADQNGSATIKLTVSDGNLLSTAQFDMYVTAVEDAPVARDDTVSVAKNGTVSFTPLTNDIDVDGDTLHIVKDSCTQPASGIVTQNGDTLTFTDTSGIAGPQYFTYTVTDGTKTATGTVNVSVGGYSFPPKISGVANQFIKEDDSTAVLPFTISDPDDANDKLSLQASWDNTTLVPNDSAHLLLVKGTGGNCTVQVIPAANASGVVNITLTVEDTSGNKTTSVFSVTVYPVNDPPVAVNDNVSVDEDSSVEVNMLANDTDVETLNQDLKVVSVSSPQHGQLKLANGKYTYAPYPDYNGSDSFTYTMTDGQITSSPATVSITVNPVNDTPGAYNIWQTLPNALGNESVTISLKQNSWDVDGDTLYFDVSSAKHGTVVNNGNGTVTYTRNGQSPEDNGADSFTYTVRDRSDTDVDSTHKANATVYIGESFSSSSWTRDVSAWANEDCAPLTIHLDFAVPGGNAFTITTGTTTLGTIANIDAVNHTVEFTPNKDANGTATISYTVTDTTAAHATTSNIYLNLYPVNDAPIFDTVPGNKEMNEDNSTEWLDASFHDVDSTGLLFNVYVANSDPAKPVLLDSGVTVDRIDDNNARIKLSPVANANGAAQVTLVASDGMLSTSSSFTLQVDPVNDAPTAGNISVKMAEDTSQTITVLGPNSDVDGDPLTVSAGTASHGAVIVNGDGTITYTPAANYAGSDQFSYTLNDGHLTATANVLVEVDNINDPPQINGLPGQSQTNEDTRLDIPFTVSDADGDTLTASVASVTSANSALFPDGSITISGTGTSRTLTLNPGSNQFGTADVTVQVDDGNGGTTKQIISITVNSVNDIPQPADDNYTTAEDTAITCTVLDNDTDVEDPHNLSIVAVSNPAHGTAQTSGGSITYTPDANWNGQDTYTYTVSDSNNGQKTATVTVDVTPVNDAPTVADDSVQTDEDTPITIDVLQNDSDVENNPLTVISTSGGSLAQSIVIVGNKIVYTPASNKNGTDTFTYTVSDEQTENSTSTGTVTVKIKPENDAPDVQNDAGNHSEDWVMDEDTTGQFMFDVSDPETDVKNLIVTLHCSNPDLVKDTSITFSGSGTVKTAQINPVLNANGNCTITVTASDGELATAKIFNLIINPVNDPPTIQAQDLTTNEDTSASGKATGTDVESSSLTFGLNTQAAHGTATVQPNGNYTYVPNANYNGADSFIVQVDDGSHAANSISTAVVNVTVKPVNDAPVANDDAPAAVDEDNPVTIDVLANDTDPDKDDPGYTHTENETLTIDSAGFTGVTHGSVSIQDKKVVFTPTSNWNGTTSFKYTIYDTHNVKSSATVTVVINAVNDPPVTPPAGNDSYTMLEDCGDQILNVLANDDVDTDTGLNANPGLEQLTLDAITVAPQNGTAHIDAATQKIIYRPSDNFNGTDSLTYTMHDKAGTPAGTFTVSLNITSVNDLPTITPVDPQTTQEDTPTDALQFTVGDVETTAGLLSVSAKSSNEILIPSDASHLAVTNTGGACTVTVTPAANRNTKSDGTATITLTVKDADGGVTTTTFVVTVNVVNDPPAAQDDAYSTDENTSVTMDVLANDDVDLGIEGDTLLLDSNVTNDGANLGTYQVVDNKIVFTPYADWTSKVDKQEKLHYTMQDASHATSNAYVTVTVTPVNDKPVLNGLTDKEIAEDTDGGTGAMPFTVSDEEDGTAVIVTATSSNQALIPDDHITVVNPGTGSCTLQATTLKDANGGADITVTAKDKDGGITTKTIHINVTPVPDPPTGGDDAYDVTEDTPKVLNVLTNDDVDTSTNPTDTHLVITAVSTPTYGKADISSDQQTILYTPNQDNNHADSFTYTVQNQTLSNTFTVDINMLAVNDAPVFASTIGNQLTSEHTAVGPLSFTVSDVDNTADSLVVTATSGNKLLVPDANITVVNPKDGTGLRYITVLPDGYWHGTATITLTVTDHDAASAQSQFKVEVASINDPPTANADSFATNEDTDCTLNVLANDTDPDLGTTSGDSQPEVLTIKSIDSTVSNADVSISGDSKKLLFHPHADWNGTVTFGYTMQDAAGLTSSSTVSVLVHAVNDAPRLTGETLSTPEDTAIDIDALANDSDIDKDTTLNTDPAYNPASESISLDANGLTGVTDGTAQVTGGKIHFVPKPNWNGVTSFTYKVLDAHGGSSTATVNLTVTQVNDPPVAVNDTPTTKEDTPVSINVLVNDTDTDTDSSLNANPSAEHLSLAQGGLGTAAHGTVSIDGSQVLYTPDANWNGTDSFTYTVQDVSLATSVGTVTVTVTPVNDAPVAVDDLKETNEDTAIQIDAVGNDTDVDTGDTLSLVSVSAADYGNTQADQGKIDYTPPADWNGTARFTYVMRDAAGLTDTGEVVVVVHGVNDPPVTVNDTAATMEDTPVTIDALANDRDIDTNTTLNNDPNAKPADEHLSLVEDGFGGLDNGTAKVVNGKIEFTPNKYWNGTEIFTYTVQDSHHATATGTVTVTVSNADDPPVAKADAATTNEDAPVLVDVLANDTDPDLSREGDNLTIESAADAAHGTVAIAGDKKALTYTPAPDWNGTDTFTYTLQDKGNQKSTAQVTVLVQPVNDPPHANDDSLTIQEDNVATVNAIANDTDVDLGMEGDSLTIASIGTVNHGTAVLTSDKKSIRFTPDLNWNGTTTFSYTMQDKANAQSSANVSITVMPVNDAPTAPTLLTPTSSDYYKDGQTVPVTWTPSTDAENDPVTYTLSFFNGSAWTELATGLTTTSYSHALANTGLASNQVCYKVEATDGQLVTADTGDKFIIDNAAPQGVQVSAQPGGSNWINRNMQLSLTAGTDLLPFEYAYSMDNANWNKLAQGGSVTVSDNGVRTVYFRAVDALGNTWTGSQECKIDKLAPAQPQITLSPAGPTNKNVAITLALAQDPGGSGNSVVRMPDGSTVSAGGSSVSYTASQNGQYSFTVYDNAGNSLSVPVTVSNIDKIAPKISINNHAYTIGDLVNKDIQVSLSVSDEGLGVASVTYAIVPGKDDAGESQTYSGDINLDKDGTYYIHATATDKAGNKTDEVFGPYRVDTTPPTIACKIENLTSSSGDIVLALSDDTGVVTVHMPDGSTKEYPAKNFEFKATKSGVYTIEIVDAAGNVSTQTVTVTLPETQVPQAAMAQNIAPVAARANTWLTAGLAVLGALLLLLILLLVLWRKQVRIEYYGKDGAKKALRVEKRFAKAPKKGELLTLDVTNQKLAFKTGSITILFRRGFTKKMRAREVLVLFGGEELLRTSIYRNQSGKWSATVTLV